MSETPFVFKGKPLTGGEPTNIYLGGAAASGQDLWTYIARGEPWKWDDASKHQGSNDSDASKAWMEAQAKKWADGGSDKIWVNGQSAIGFRPNNPGTVQPGETFLLGAIRHNNLPIKGGANVKQFLHSRDRKSVV